MGLRQNHAVRPPRQVVMLRKAFLVVLEFRRIHKADQRHSLFSFANRAPVAPRLSVRNPGEIILWGNTPSKSGQQSPKGHPHPHFLKKSLDVIENTGPSEIKRPKA